MGGDILPHRGLAALASVLLVLLVACGQPVVTTEPVYQSIQAQGSTTLSPLVTELAAAFHEQAPAVSLAVDGRAPDTDWKHCGLARRTWRWHHGCLPT